MLLKKQITDDMLCKNEEFAELQSAILYMASSLDEANVFLKNISQGHFDVPIPSRHNFLASDLKELHSNLRHLTWQASQVSNGDYSQKVSFLGEFSEAFNQMTSQLSERESTLKEQTKIVEDGAKLILSIVDGIKEWIIVTSRDNGELLYANTTGKTFLDLTKASINTDENNVVLDFIKNYHNTEHLEASREFTFNEPYTVLVVNTYSIKWGKDYAFVHYIADRTNEKELLNAIEVKAFTDELTGINNRHFLKDTFKDYIENDLEFSFCMIDLDGLKYANDNFGHAAGDDYLKLVAKLLIEHFDKEDIVCRLGGDEFAVLTACKHSDEVSKRVSEVDNILMNYGFDFPMSISYGAIDVSNFSIKSEEEIIETADFKMYEFKKMRKKERLK
ncbi:MAG: diguanylate cyclase [Lachnospirales bacterium]